MNVHAMARQDESNRFHPSGGGSLLSAALLTLRIFSSVWAVKKATKKNVREQPRPGGHRLLCARRAPPGCAGMVASGSGLAGLSDQAFCSLHSSPFAQEKMQFFISCQAVQWKLLPAQQR